MENPMPLTILITGANRGIGLALTEQYLNKGARVIATCRKPEAAKALQTLQKTHPQLTILQLDVTNILAINTLAKNFTDPIDILINNAGVGSRNDNLKEVELTPWLQIMQTNAFGPLALTRALLPNLRLGNQKKVIMMTSRIGSIADNSSGGSYAYRASKAALNTITKSLAIDLTVDGIKVLSIHPGWVQTDMGGPNALIDVHTSTAGMMREIDNLTMQKSGGFVSYNGEQIPW
jgi:NAD(P)-dependent dehydrogenase (short-subunit alcohol dehydrogenase family)